MVGIGPTVVGPTGVGSMGSTGMVGIGPTVVGFGSTGMVGIGAAVVTGGTGIVGIGGDGIPSQGILGSQQAILGHSQRTRATLQCNPGGQFISHLMPLLHL